MQLGGSFHRSRIRLISSQVSSIEPELRGRWSKERLQKLAWHMVEELNPRALSRTVFPCPEAAEAYRSLDRNAGEALQVVLTY